jgi:hypothetical protein
MGPDLRDIAADVEAWGGRFGIIGCWDGYCGRSGGLI